MLRVMLIGGVGGAQVVSAVERSRHRIIWVIDTESAASPLVSLRQVAIDHGRTVWPGRAIKDPNFPKLVNAAGIDVILSVRSRYILPPALLEAPQFGSYNLHPGPLPQYAGRNGVSWALYNGETDYGITLHRMIASVDQGPIVASERFPISPNDTALTLTRRCLKVGLPMLTQLLDEIGEKRAPPEMEEQDLINARYYSVKDKPDLRLDWRKPAAQLLNLARACEFHPFPSPWGLPTTGLDGKTFHVLRVRPEIGGAALNRASGTVVAIEEKAAIVAAGDRAVRLETFLLDGTVIDAVDAVEVGDRFDFPS